MPASRESCAGVILYSLRWSVVAVGCWLAPGPEHPARASAATNAAVRKRWAGDLRGVTGRRPMVVGGVSLNDQIDLVRDIRHERRMLVVDQQREERVMARRQALGRCLECRGTTHPEHCAHAHHGPAHAVDVDVPVAITLEVGLAEQVAGWIEVVDRDLDAEGARHGVTGVRRKNLD